MPPPGSRRVPAARFEIREPAPPRRSRHRAMSLFFDCRLGVLEFDRNLLPNRSEEMVQACRPPPHGPGLEHELVDEPRLFPRNVVVTRVEMRALRGDLVEGLRE